MATLASKAVGSIVKLNWDGSPREFIIVHQGLPSSMYDESCNGTWLLQKDIFENREWNSSNVNDYANSTINAYLNGEWFGKLDADIQAVVKQVKIPYRPGSGTSQTITSGGNGLSAKIFLLSGTEVGLTQSGSNQYVPNNEGVRLSYFEVGIGTSALNKRIGKLNGSAVSWWIRSPYCNSIYDAMRAMLIYTNGDLFEGNCSESYGVRPALILPPETMVSDDGFVITNNPPTAPGSITVPQVSGGASVAISWTAATDSDGTISAYHLERSVNESGWAEIYTGPALTYTDTIGTSWGTVAYRVCAEDDKGATGPYAESDTQEVQAGVLYISGPAPGIGMVTEVTNFWVKVNISGQTEPVPNIQLSLQLDGATIYDGVVVTNYTLNLPLDPRIIGGGVHTITATAEKQDYITATQTYTFVTPVLNLPDGGIGTQLQDGQGRAIFPQTSAALVQGMKGQSVGANLEELYAVTGLLMGATLNELIITFAPEFEGAQFTVTDGTDTITGTVPADLVATVRVSHNNSVYTVSATADNGIEYTVSVATSSYSGQQAVNLAVFDASASVTAVPGAIVSATNTENGNIYTATAEDNGVAVVQIHQPGAYTISAVKGNAPSDTVQLQVTEEDEYTATVNFIVLTVKSVEGSALTLTDGETTFEVESTTGEEVFYLPNTGTWTGTITKDGETATGSVNCSAYQNYTLELSFVKIYGVSWDGTSTTKWTRTDDAASFVDPVPYVSGATTYSSPFDNRLPWSGMVKSERAGGTMVAIPKFWYKLIQNGAGMKIQIADKPVEGFSPSPAHMDRGDGKGERDVVYVGRYHCGSSNYKSVKGQTPKNNITRATARTEIHKLGTNIWQSDFAMRFTIWLLYIVEFADWNSQKTIGKGCGNNSASQAMGYTDSMPYHTGTTKSSRDTYGLGTQYRYIEGLWDNVLDCCDGCYNADDGFHIILNLNEFSDTTGGVSVGTPSSGYTSAFSVKNVLGAFVMFIPTAADGSKTTYSCDSWNFDASRFCVCVGGGYTQFDYCGLFYVHYTMLSGADTGIGSRSMELP